jgi:hypothetical protein
MAAVEGWRGRTASVPLRVRWFRLVQEWSILTGFVSCGKSTPSHHVAQVAAWWDGLRFTSVGRMREFVWRWRGLLFAYRHRRCRRRGPTVRWPRGEGFSPAARLAWSGAPVGLALRLRLRFWGRFRPGSMAAVEGWRGRTASVPLRVRLRFWGRFRCRGGGSHVLLGFGWSTLSATCAA